MVAAAAGSNGILFERAQRWRRLARVENGDAGAGRVNEAPGDGCYPGQALKKVERRTLGGEHRHGGAAHFGEDGTRLAAIAVVVLQGNVHTGIELAECFRGDV